VAWPLAPAGVHTLNKTTTKDGPKTYSKSWGTCRRIAFSHRWLMNADAGDGQMFFLLSLGFRYGFKLISGCCVALDRRSQGRSSQPLKQPRHLRR
jgi:hypothetical protein